MTKKTSVPKRPDLRKNPYRRLTAEISELQYHRPRYFDREHYPEFARVLGRAKERVARQRSLEPFTVRHLHRSFSVNPTGITGWTISDERGRPVAGWLDF
jgi:hypothetical protein